jgi:hypothetical protein
LLQATALLLHLQKDNPFFLCNIGFSEQTLPTVGARTLDCPGWTSKELYLQKAIITCMARGWESKSVEAQQDEAAARTTSARPRLTREATERLREKENLRLALQNVLQQLERSRGLRHRTLLENARADLLQKIGRLESQG